LTLVCRWTPSGCRRASAGRDRRSRERLTSTLQREPAGHGLRHQHRNLTGHKSHHGAHLSARRGSPVANNRRWMTDSGARDDSPRNPSGFFPARLKPPSVRAAETDLREDNARGALSELADGLHEVAERLTDMSRPPAVLSERLRKDASLDHLANIGMNVAQFVSFAPQNRKPTQQYSRIVGRTPNDHFTNAREAIVELLARSADRSVNVRSYEPFNAQSREFLYGISSVDEAIAGLNRLTAGGLHTIVNETVDVKDGGVSGVLMGNVLEFAPDDTPRCVEKSGTAALPRGWGRELLSTVYRFPVELDVPLASRLEFSLHPRPRGWRQTNILTWEFSGQIPIVAKPPIAWPNRFSRLLGDKVYGLLIAHHVGLPVPYTTVINRRVASFSFGRRTESGESWIRTAPIEQEPGRGLSRCPRFLHI
jgi:hypothetical protein